jgi:3-isopropylmalate/(R)-2-methylmalate dehydratase small subunit
LLPVILPPADHARLLSLLAAKPDAEVSIDLATQRAVLPDGSTVAFPIDGFSKTCMLEGVDELGFLLRFGSEISVFESGRREPPPTTGVAV